LLSIGQTRVSSNQNLVPLYCCVLLVLMQAAVGAVRCYLALHDAPAAAAAATAADEASLAALSPEERKKEKLRRKKVYCYLHVTWFVATCVVTDGGNWQPQQLMKRHWQHSARRSGRRRSCGARRWVV
jgi:hypothetical protein